MQTKLCTLAALALTASPVLAAGVNNTLFLNHFDSPIAGGAGPADYANGDPAEQIGLPLGPGGTVSATNPKFGAASLDRSTGGRVEYNTAGNFDASKGTIEMWVRGSGVTGGGFVGLWGTDTGSGSGDIRMYIYDTGAGRTLGAYMNQGLSGTFWEIEQPIPLANLDSTNWHHVAWTYDTTAGTTATYWDGTQIRNTPDAGTVNPHPITNTLMHIGENQAGSATFPGFIDEFRISDNIRYTGNFTPPTAPFAVPEPASLATVTLAGLAMIRRRRSV